MVAAGTPTQPTRNNTKYNKHETETAAAAPPQQQQQQKQPWPLVTLQVVLSISDIIPSRSCSSQEKDARFREIPSPLHLPISLRSKSSFLRFGAGSSPAPHRYPYMRSYMLLICTCVFAGSLLELLLTFGASDFKWSCEVSQWPWIVVFGGSTHLDLVFSSLGWFCLGDTSVHA